MKEETRKCPGGGLQAAEQSSRLLSDLSASSICSPLLATEDYEMSLVREEKGRSWWSACTVEGVEEGGS